MSQPRRGLLMATLVLAAVSSLGCGPASSETTADAQGISGGVDASYDPGPQVCGDGRLQIGETCDPVTSCPTSCPASCMVGTLVGSTVTCDVRCDYVPITTCLSGDGCCPSGCDELSDSECTGIRIADQYASDYTLVDLGPVPGVPPRLGGLTVKAGDSTRLLIGGNANTAEGSLYEIGVTRDSSMHIIGFSGTAMRVGEAAWNDGGIVYGPGGVLFLARWPVNELGQMRPGAIGAERVTPLAGLGVADALASVLVLPTGFPGAGQVKGLSWSGGEWTTLAIQPDGSGLYDVTGATPGVVLTGGPEGMVTVPPGSPLFTGSSLLVSEYSAGTVAVYDVDGNGDPIPATRRDFVVGLDGAEGAAIDPTSGDFLFSTFGGGDRLIVVRGFKPIIID